MNIIDQKLYLAGGGIASLSAAVFAIRDGKIMGKNIFIFDSAKVLGGALDGFGNPEKGYTAIGARKYDKTIESYACLYDLMKSIPGIENRGKNLFEEFLEWNEKFPKVTKARFTNKEKQAYKLIETGLSRSDTFKLIKLCFIPENRIEKRTIESWFSKAFFQTDFWYGFASMFGFKHFHDLIEFRRYIRKFAHSFQHMKASGEEVNPVEVTHPINQYESLILPVQKWLEKQGVNFLLETVVNDLDFLPGEKITVNKIHYAQKGVNKTIELSENDRVFITNGSKVANTTYGTMDTPAPKPDLSQLHPSWQLWKNIADKKPDRFGNPGNFYSQVEKSEWLFYCVTTKDKTFFDLFQQKTGNAPGDSDIVTSVNSPWLFSVQIPAQPHFINQPEDVYFWLGYGLYSNKTGQYVKKTMNECSGAEILTEIIYQYGFEEHLDKILATSNCIPIYEPYVTAQFLPRKINDRPKVVPKNSTNLAFTGQFVENGECVFLVELSVRTGMEAVYEMFNIEKKPLPLYIGFKHLSNIMNLVKVMHN